MAKRDETGRVSGRGTEPRKAPVDDPIGTIHDPNSVTTGTDVEPKNKLPPKT